MKCHQNDEKNEKNRQHSTWKHMVHMVLCCGLPFLIILVLPVIAGFSTKTATVLGLIAPFICPVMMGGMMLMMLKGRKNSAQHNPGISSNLQIPDHKQEM